jgi:hypothetical protein
MEASGIRQLGDDAYIEVDMDELKAPPYQKLPGKGLFIGGVLYPSSEYYAEVSSFNEKLFWPGGLLSKEGLMPFYIVR